MSEQTETDLSYYEALAAAGKIQPRQIKALAAAHKDKPLAALHGDPALIISRLEHGEGVDIIAHEYGVSRIAMYAWLLRHCPDQWQAISAARQLSRLDDCESMIDNAETDDVRRDNVNITRAREAARMAQWHLERANRKLFGQRIDSEHSGSVSITAMTDAQLDQRLQELERELTKLGSIETDKG